MGYSTQFKGELKFTREPTAKELAFIKSMFHVDDEQAKELGLVGAEHISYVQFEFTDGFDGIRWDGSEKFYKAVEAVNFVIDNAKAHCNGLSLTGSLAAQGDEPDDRWILVIGDDGRATRSEQPVVGQKITCPHCQAKFLLKPQA